MEINPNNTAEKGGAVHTPTHEPEAGVNTSKILDHTTWSRKEYMFLVAGIMIQAFVYSFEVNLMYNCIGAITALFDASSLASILPTILQILSAALVPFYTKISDVIGRAQALTIAMVFYIIGYIIQGTSHSFLQFALGQISYGIGSTGMLTLTQVLIADTTLLANRGILFAMWDLPSVMNIFVTNLLTDKLTLPPADWHNVYVIVGTLSAVGGVAILIPLWYLQKKGERQLQEPVRRRSFSWFLHEFDAIGAVLLTLTMALTLIPMIVARTYEGNWKNGSIIAMFCSGIVCGILLVIWEVKFTDRPIMPSSIWANRTAFGGLVVGFVMTVMASMNWMYYTLYLVISRDLSFGDALMLERGYQVAYLVFQLITGFLMKRYNTCRPFIWVGIVIHTIGIGLMIPARAPSSSDAFVVISQTIVGAAGGMANIASSVAVTGVVAKKHIATVIGVTQIMGSFGSAFGGALAGGIWTQYLPTRLAHHITGPYDEAGAMNSPLNYIPTLDSLTRSQLVEAYSDSQKLMSIISCAIAVFACCCTVLMQHVDLRQDQEEQDAAANGSTDSLPMEEKN